MNDHCYFVYMLRCADGSYYTGVTNNIERRLEEHHSGMIATCYTYTLRPLVLVFCEEYQFVNEAIAVKNS